MPIGSSTPTRPILFDIRPLLPYQCARDDYRSGILLDANENAHGHSISLFDFRGFSDGPDEVIDLLVHICVTSVSTLPTYVMYTVCTQINDVGIVIYLELSADGSEGGDKGRFSLRVGEVCVVLSVEQVKGAINENSSIKIIFLCIVVVDAAKDEAYIDFPEPGSSVATLITLGKSFPLLIQILSNNKAPYNISAPTAHLALYALSPASLRTMNANIERIKVSRLGSAIGVQDANFILIPVLPREILVADSVCAQCVYKALAEEGVVLGMVVHYQGSKSCCPGVCTVGTE
ncbi:hypothetical protein EDB89DRAFT_2222497 [Lactarius sanguifluus]|nr:hypothetical protein EDB89DRAFT_2222497 [Lactarius sanguifluus]